VSDWLVTVNVRGTLAVSVTCKIKQERKWKTHDKETTRSTTKTLTTTTTITVIKRTKIVDTDNRGTKMSINFCLYQHNFDKQPRKNHIILVCCDVFSPGFMIEGSTHSKQSHKSVINILIIAVKTAASNDLTMACLLLLK
jgi:hypothetical protein